MKHKHVFAICAYKDSPYLESCIRSLVGQRTKSPVILCTSTPSPYIDGLAGRYGIPVFVRDGASNMRDDWNFAYHMADGELVTIAHQDDVYHKDYVTELLRAYRRYPDMTMFTSDYVIVKNGALITGDKMLLVKRLLRLPLRFPALNDRVWEKAAPDVRQLHLLPGVHLPERPVGRAAVFGGLQVCPGLGQPFGAGGAGRALHLRGTPASVLPGSRRRYHQTVHRKQRPGPGGRGNVPQILARGGGEAADDTLPDRL